MKPEKKKYLIKRLLEILPGFTSWNLILFPIWGAFVAPVAVAYFILLFDVFWVYQSVSLAVFGLIAYFRIEASKNFDWLGEIKSFPDWKKVHHIVIVCTYKEPLYILERTLNSLADQTMPKNQMSIVVGFEKRETGWEEKAAELEKSFSKKFANLIFSEHTLIPGETAGKHSNAKAAILKAKKQLVDGGKINLDYTTVTSCDADHVYHPNHFTCLAYKFLDNPNRYFRFWQPAIVFYNNFWRLPAPVRVVNTIGTIWCTAQLVRTDRLINQQNYSLSLKLLDKIGYWDVDVIPEDWHIFFKAFFATSGKIEVEPIYLPLMADAAQSTSLFKTVKNQYEQFKRWAWGVSDDPYVIIKYFSEKNISFENKTLRVLRMLKDHFLWPVNFFIITFGVNIPILFNKEFAKTALGFNLPNISSLILTLCLLPLGIVVFWDAKKQRPPRPKDVPKIKSFLIPFEFILMPVVGFIFGALPGLDAHTRLMLGKYIEYRVTEKI